MSAFGVTDVVQRSNEDRILDKTIKNGVNGLLFFAGFGDIPFPH